MDSLKAIVFAAGEGRRIRNDSPMPKVMMRACGRPLLGYVLNALSFIPPSDIIIVVGYMQEAVRAAFPKYQFAYQAERLGTGHAMMRGLDAIMDYDGPVITCSGDTPLVRKGTYRAVYEHHLENQNTCTILSGFSSFGESDLGRIIRDENGSFVKIAEQRDCTPEQLMIREYNVGVMITDAGPLRAASLKLRQDNEQFEYYASDVPSIISESGGRVEVYKSVIPDEVLGVNTTDQLEMVEYKLREANLQY